MTGVAWLLDPLRNISSDSRGSLNDDYEAPSKSVFLVARRLQHGLWTQTRCRTPVTRNLDSDTRWTTSSLRFLNLELEWLLRHIFLIQTNVGRSLWHVLWIAALGTCSSSVPSAYISLTWMIWFQAIKPMVKLEEAAGWHMYDHSVQDVGFWSHRCSGLRDKRNNSV